MTKAEKRSREEADAAREELDRLRARHDELAADLEEARGALQAAQTAVIEADGGDAPEEEAIRLQARILTGEATLEELDRQKAAAKEALDAAEASANVEAAKEQMVREAGEAADAKAAYESAYVELGECLERLGGELNGALTQWQLHAKRFQALHDDLYGGGLDSALMEEIEGRGAPLRPTLEQAAAWRGITKYRYTPPAVGTYESIVTEVLKKAGQEALERDMEERRARRAEHRKARAQVA